MAPTYDPKTGPPRDLSTVDRELSRAERALAIIYKEYEKKNGLKGEKGDKGDKGEKGEKGEKGDKGAGGDVEKKVDDNARKLFTLEKEWFKKTEGAAVKAEGVGFKPELLGIAIAAGIASMDIKLFKADFAYFDFSDYFKRFSHAAKTDPEQRRLRNEAKFNKAKRIEDRAESIDRARAAGTSPITAFSRDTAKMRAKVAQLRSEAKKDMESILQLEDEIKAARRSLLEFENQVRSSTGRVEIDLT
ncbi:hypothetical protein ACIBF1_14920 [Spirillospora sp. NPDC050679]